MDQRLKQQLDFILEVGKLKNIFRRSLICSGDRYENDAEHSWHLALMVMVLQEYAIAGTEILEAMKMVIIHDIVEIDAGDTFAYDTQGYESKEVRERQAADRIFKLLPLDQSVEMRALWDEFELMTSPSAKFATALDRMQPLLLNYLNKGQSWKKYGINADQVLERNAHIEQGTPVLWSYVESLIEKSIVEGLLIPRKATK